MAYDVTKIFQGAPMVKLGELIEPKNERNSDLRYGIDLIEGVTSEGIFAPTKAVTDGINLKPYKAVRKGDFVYNPSRLNIGSLAYRDTDNMCIVSHLYVVFHIKESKSEVVLPEFLLMFFRRDDFKRTIDIHNFGSQRAEFNIKQLSEIEIPLPAIEVQREYVAAYRSLQQLAEQNEALAAPLQDACNAFLAKAKEKYPLEAIGNYIKIEEEKNINNQQYPFMGVDITKKIVPTSANTDSLDAKKYIIVRKNKLVFSGMQTGRDIAIRIAIHENESPVLISSAYTTFIVKDETILLPQFLYLNFLSHEKDRIGWFYSDASVRSNLDWPRFCDIKIPLPPIEVQRSIVALYNCAEEARAIAKEAREQLKILAPAMVQRAANTPVEL